MHMLHMAMSAVAAVGPVVSGDGVLGWVDSKNTEVLTTVRGLTFTLAVIFVVMAAVKSKGAMSTIIVSLIAAGIFVAGVWNITTVKDKVSDEINSGLVSRHVIHDTAATRV